MMWWWLCIRCVGCWWSNESFVELLQWDGNWAGDRDGHTIAPKHAAQKANCHHIHYILPLFVVVVVVSWSPTGHSSILYMDLTCVCPQELLSFTARADQMASSGLSTNHTHSLPLSLSLSLSFCLSVCLALWLPHLVTPVALLSPTLSDSCPPFMQALHPSLLICRRSQWHRCFFGGCFVRPRSGQRGT